MLDEPYLIRLTNRLIDGLDGLPDATRELHISYLRASQNPDGGFPGREGGSDLYYTGFALRSLAALGALTPEVCTKAAAFLQARMAGSAQVVDFFSLLISAHLVPLGGGPNVFASATPDWSDRVAATLESFRAADGGYARSPGGPHGSTYTSFLVALALQLLEKPIPEPERLAAFVRGRRREDGGYAEFSVAKRGQTNLTAAAIGLLQMLGALDSHSRETATEFLLGTISSDEGGLMAHARIPFADVLSTFTGAWTLDQLGAAERLDWPALSHFVESCERPEGGFRGAALDDRGDVEYTFYGLGTLALARLMRS